jgi:hypothetical protein
MGVPISTYKDIEIIYENGFFDTSTPGVNLHSETEADLKKQIDQHLKTVKEEECKKKKVEEESKLNKNLNKKVVLKFNDFYYLCQSDVFCEADLHFENQKLTLIEMDPANVAMAYRQIKYAGALNKFSALVNLNNVFQLLKQIRKIKKPTSKTSITLWFEPRETLMRMMLEGDFGRIEFPAIKSVNDVKKWPDLTFLAQANINKDKFQNIIKLMSLSDYSVRLTVKDKKLVFHCEGNEGSVNISSNPVPCSGKDCSSKFSTEYLDKFTFKGNKLQLHLSKDYPLVIIDEFDNRYCLAPRVEHD